MELLRIVVLEANQEAFISSIDYKIMDIDVAVETRGTIW